MVPPLFSTIEDAAARLGIMLQGDLAEIREYFAARTLHLSTLAGQPGYMEAVIAERDALALKLGLVSVNQADGADRELLGTIAGVMAVAAW
jgi:hypothetical protein